MDCYLTSMTGKSKNLNEQFSQISKEIRLPKVQRTYCCNTLASRKYFLTHDLFFAFAALFIMFVSSDTICLKKGGYNLQFKCSTKFCKLRILTNALILREIFPLETKHCQCTIMNKTKMKTTAIQMNKRFAQAQNWNSFL